jgi:hypothetical protein
MKLRLFVERTYFLRMFFLVFLAEALDGLTSLESELFMRAALFL